MSRKTAVIGLGNIGGGVARNLARAGVSVRATDLDPEKVAAVVAVGGVASASAAEGVAEADIVFTSLPGPKHIAAVATEILPTMRPNTLWVELSTNDLDTARSLATQCHEVGVRLIDAPVSGGPEGAEAGTLSIFVGGADADVAHVRPLLEIIGSKIDHLGDHGTGIAAKIAQVTLCYTQTVTLIEALILGSKAGIEPSKMLDLIQNSAGTSYCATAYGPEILAGTYDASFPLGHAVKDMRLAMDLAQTVHADLPHMAKVAELYEQAETEYGSAAGHLFAAQLIERTNDMVLHQQGETHG
ncbi:MAG: 3-hydroxyisobutyrate dehydrogenase [Verrucomicrobiales bacterium]|jgi:3-hydroxyisobutyrate dehydrogenase